MKKILLIGLLFSALQIYGEDDLEDQEQEDTSDLRIPAAPINVPAPVTSAVPAPTTSSLPAPAAPQKPSQIWNKPLIIDSDNHDFDRKSIVHLDENIIYQPNINYVYPQKYINYPAAIIVNKDNITIDLRGFNLSFSPQSAPNFMYNSSTYGIAVYQGVKNLKIISSMPNGTIDFNRKGSITGFSGFAIYAYGWPQTFNNYDPNYNLIQNMTIDNLFITCNKNGIAVFNALNPTITNSDIIYNYSPFVMYGIYFSNVINGSIENCVVNQNWSYTDVYGINLEDTANLIVQNCTANSNASIKNGNATGFSIAGSTLSSGLSSSNFISNCTANRNLCGYFTGKTTTGFFVGRNSVNNTLNGNTTLRGGYSPLFPGQIPPITTPTSTGFLLDATANFTIMNNNTAGYQSNIGFLDQSAVSTSYFTTNTSMFNVISNYSVTVPNHVGPAGPLATTKLYANDVAAFTGSGPQLVNLDIQTS